MPENLKELLKKNGITEKELATRAGISEQTIKRICNGKNKSIRVSTVKKICEALGESADFIYLGIGGDDPGEEETIADLIAAEHEEGATADLIEEATADLIEEGTADLIAAEHGLNREDIKTRIERRC